MTNAMLKGQDGKEIACCRAQVNLLYEYFEAGRLARKQGMPVSACPYRRHTKQQGSWVAGWLAIDLIGGRRC